MESGSVSIQKEERDKKCNIYVEEYVLSYLKREADSLELSEIYFYGHRKNEGKEIFVYGAGREKEITAFAEYELLTELVCRLTQAGPVFMVRGADGSCKTTGFQVFYENNEAMQSFLIGWTGSGDKNRTAETNVEQAMPVLHMDMASGGMKKHTVHGAISVQLCLILVVLVAIVISSTDSFEKMEQLGQSAKEVLFAIENQETEEMAKNPGEQTEIVVERETKAEIHDGEEEGANAEDMNEQSEEDPSRAETLETGAAGSEGEAEEGILEPAETKEEASEEKNRDENRQEDSAALAEEQEKEKPENTQSAEIQSDEENEEALSRSITRYYEVEQGDTLYTISQEIYGDISRVGKICEVNQISDPDKIRSGQKIILP